MRSLVPFAVLAAVAFAGCAAPPGDDEAVGATGEALVLSPVLPSLVLCTKDTYVPSQYGTVQAAVDATCSGGTVHIGPGSYVGATITDKRVSVVGAGSGATSLRAPAFFATALGFRGRAAGTVSELAITSGWVGVGLYAAATDASAIPVDVTLRNVVVTGTMDGVSGRARGVTVETTEIHHTNIGIDLTGASYVVIRGSIVHDETGDGIRVQMAGTPLCSVSLEDVRVAANGGRGASIDAAGLCTVDVLRLLADHDTQAGLAITRSPGASIRTSAFTTTQPKNGLFGDGLVARDAHVHVDGCAFDRNARAGISAWGSAVVSIARTTLTCNAFDLEVEDAARFEDGGGVACAAPSDCGSYGSCHAVSTSLTPVPL